MADRTTSDAPPEAPRRGWGLLRHVPLRAVAAGWWVVMVFITVCVTGGWVDLILHPQLQRLIGTSVVTAVFFVPVAKEWPHWRQMRTMLLTGR